MAPAFQGLSQATRRAAESMRGLYSQFSYLDETLSFPLENHALNTQEYRSFLGFSVEEGVLPSSAANPFELEERAIVLVDPVVPNLPEWGAYRRPRISLPANWAEMRADVPLPNMTAKIGLSRNWTP